MSVLAWPVDVLRLFHSIPHLGGFCARKEQAFAQPWSFTVFASVALCSSGDDEVGCSAVSEFPKVIVELPAASQMSMSYWLAVSCIRFVGSPPTGASVLIRHLMSCLSVISVDVPSCDVCRDVVVNYGAAVVAAGSTVWSTVVRNVCQFAISTRHRCLRCVICESFSFLRDLVGGEPL
jgi:hypothetical protein